MDIQLIKRLNNRSRERAEEKDFDNTKVYKVEGETETLYYWNSSNSDSIQHDLFLEAVMDKVLDSEADGSISDGWNEIMFETEFN
jgi:hypothetical protein